MSNQNKYASNPELQDQAQKSLQKNFELLGGKESVIDFLVAGATDGNQGVDRNWDTFTTEERQLWLTIKSTYPNLIHTILVG